MNSKEIETKMKAARFVANNGKVLRAINLLRIKFVSLSELKSALEIPENEYLDCINFLFESSYIVLRLIKTKANANLADHEYEDLESKLSDKGIRLLAGKIYDDSVEV